jgi:ribonuclease HI
MHWLNWSDMTRSKLHGGMGFRDLSTFNLAMLGKQGWRLMMKPNSLVARVLKGKYYPHCDFMKAKKGRHSSHTWRAIISGRTVLNMGLIKRVGTGTNINIWEDKWIPSNPSLRPMWKPDNTQLTLVSDLIQENGKWDDHLIRNSFLPPDADAILSIPLGGLDCDTLAWAFEKHGMYSVRSAYHCLSNNTAARRHIDPTSSRGSDHPMWRQCWQLKVLPKIKHFWWRVLHEFIPTMGVLMRRHIGHIGACAFCGNNDESIFHAIISCPANTAIWKAVKDATGVKLPCLHPKTWASDIISGKVCSSKDAETITTTAYAIWTNRNKEKRGDHHISPNKVACWVAGVLQEVSDATRRTDHNEKKLIKWNPPPENTIKINIDGSFNPMTGTGATGCVARDSMGHFLAARSRWYNSVANALSAEALAYRDGVELANILSFQRIMVETDCHNLVQLWKARQHHRSEIMGVLLQTQEIASQLLHCNLIFVRREANFAAHLCAQQASRQNMCSLWSGTIPPFLARCIQNDCNMLADK